jgi:FKBP-type peptidyl-prolyl cis-trans isomerase
MHSLTKFALPLTIVAFSACTGGAASYENAALDTEDQKASYGIGLQMGGQLAAARDDIQIDALVRGLQDAMNGREPAVPQDDLQTAIQSFGQRVMAKQQADHDASAERNRTEGAAYLAENAKKPGVTTTESGLQYEVLREGDGPRPGPDSDVTINYKGTLIDGTQFDSSYDRGEPTTFNVNGVIAGFSEGLKLMPVGSKYRLVIPGDLAYGPGGSGQQIGPFATLIFEVEMLEVGN